ERVSEKLERIRPVRVAFAALRFLGLPGRGPGGWGTRRGPCASLPCSTGRRQGLSPASTSRRAEMNDRDRPVSELAGPGRWLRAPACRLGLLVWATLACSNFARADQALLQDVSGAYEKHRQALTSLLVHYTEKTEYLLPTEKLTSIGMIPVLPESVEITVC